MNAPKKTRSFRAARAAERLADLRAAPPERRAQCLNDWLYVATVAEVRRNWRKWMGIRPEWA